MTKPLEIQSYSEWNLFTRQERPLMIAGPCSAESEEQLFNTATQLKNNGIEVLRAGIWKPRTRPNCFEGVGVKGLPWLQNIQKELGMKISTEVAKYLPDVEIIEMHHNNKLDAPSGTSIMTANMIAAARKEAGIEPAPDKTHESLEGARGTKVDGIPIHSVRLPGYVAHQQVLFGGYGEYLTIRHDSIDRKSFMPGVILAVKKVGSHPGLTFGLENFL